MTVYVDMDGVIADFFGAVADHYGVSHWKDLDNTEEAITALGGEFFKDLPKFTTSDELIATIDEATDGDWCILSSPLTGDTEGSIFWKQHWLDKHGYKPKEAIFTHNKKKYAKGNLLIDDRPLNISKWVQAGGTGYQYQANRNSFKHLKQFIKDFS